MKKIKLAVLPGDGIGQDVTLSAIPVFEALQIPVEITLGDIGWEFWKKEGNPVPKRTWDLIHSSDAVLLGATTSKPEREALKELQSFESSEFPIYVSPIIQLRQNLNLYANVRPCFNIQGNKKFNFVVIRENTEGLYAGFDYYPLPSQLQEIIKQNNRWQHITNENASCSFRLQSKKGLKNLFEFAFKYADTKKFSRVTFADKPNVLRKSSAFSRKIFECVAKQYPHIQADIHNVDAVALWMVKRPYEFGVIVAENMFGDILSDLGAGIMGGLGFAGSANIGEKGCYFEPVHGSAPRLSPNTANPSAMFLTIGLLLEHFSYHAAAQKIKKAIQSVIKDDKYVTYDLGGAASTQTMANAIIQNCQNLSERKRIAFLATGSEIIHGDLQESNCHFFAKLVSQNGGQIYQHLNVSDKKNEISTAIEYLLNKSDALVITGGLGPTSDDNTRFAVADYVQRKLYFDDVVWQHIVQRLEHFHLVATESNRQQALFPIDSFLYPNKNGTAFGFYLKYEEKIIFVLPGPPKECIPLFEEHVLSKLKDENFFHKISTLRWVTLGLIESEVASQIDNLSKFHKVETAYRWHYPYLEIKLISENFEGIQELALEIDDFLKPYLVSKEQKDSFEILENTVRSIQHTIHIVDDVTSGEFEKKAKHQKLKFISAENNFNSEKILFILKSSQKLNQNSEYEGTINFNCIGFVENCEKYSHQISVPYRGKEILDYAKHYAAWQLNKFIESFGDCT